MNPRVIRVNPLENFQLKLTFSNGEVGLFDAKPYLEKGIFKELKNPELFNEVNTSLGSIAWKSGQDLCPDTLYLESKIFK